MDLRQHSPAVARNREPILHVLEATLPTTGRVLEVGAGSGEHAVFFAERFPGLIWQPTDADMGAIQSIQAWRKAEGSDNLLAPRPLDTRELDQWPTEPLDAIFSANMIHISPWECALGLLDGAARLLKPGGVLMLYGPFMVDGQHTAPSNAQFDDWLKNKDPSWGVRDKTVVEAEAKARGLVLSGQIAMPANNFTLVFRRA